MASFKELSDTLSKVLVDVEAKKATLEKATKEVQEASNAYNDALTSAKELKSQMIASLDETIPESAGARVR